MYVFLAMVFSFILAFVILTIVNFKIVRRLFSLQNYLTVIAADVHQISSDLKRIKGDSHV